MMSWTIISLVNSGGLEGKLVLFSCGLEELSLIKAVKLSHVMLKLEERARPSHIRAGIKSKHNGSNQHEDRNINSRVKLPSLETFHSRLIGQFFLPFWNKQKPISLNSEEIIHCNPLACSIKQIKT